MKYTAADLDRMRSALAPLMRCRGRLGLEIYKNHARISRELAEYDKLVAEAFAKYGEDELVNGEPTGKKYIPRGSAAFDECVALLNGYASSEYEFVPYLVGEEDVLAADLSGEEIGSISWMLKEEVR